MVDVNLIAKTVKVVKSVNIIERDTIVKSAVEKASALTRDRELSVKIAEDRRSVHTEDRSQDVKNASEPLLYLFITRPSYEKFSPPTLSKHKPSQSADDDRNHRKINLMFSCLRFIRFSLILYLLNLRSLNPLFHNRSVR